MRAVRILAVVAAMAGTMAVRADDSSPATQIKGMMNAVANMDAKALLGAMPKSYRNDTQELIREAVGKVDPEVWDKGFATAKKALKVLRNKKEIVVQMGEGQLPPGLLQPGDLGKLYDGVVNIVEAPVNSDLATHSMAKSLDLDAWSVGTTEKVFKAIAAIDVKLPPKQQTLAEGIKGLADAKVEVVGTEGDVVEIKVQVPDAPPARPAKFRKVEGVWVPAQMADGWAKGMEKARAELTKANQKVDKAKALEMIKGLDEVIASIDAANDPGSLIQAITEAGEKLKAIAKP